MLKSKITNSYTLSKRDYFNTGDGVQLYPIDIGHKHYIGLISPDTAFWSLVKKSQINQALTSISFLRQFRKKEKSFLHEMNTLRFKLKPSAVYFNPTDRCNMNCSYCYIPDSLRKNGKHSSTQNILKTLETLQVYFKSSLPEKQRPQIVFHGAEPMLNKKAIFSALDKFGEYFRFGIQTNGTLLDKQNIDFLISKGISIGLSLDGHTAKVANRLRKTWSRQGVFQKVIEAMNHLRLRGYKNYSVICTVTRENMSSLVKMVEFLHKMEVPVCILNPVRCTLPEARKHKPLDSELAKYYLEALDCTYELYKKTGRKLIIANFANILVSIIAPAGRRLMCDISPCGGGRCFFAISSNGDLFPCSEFIGLKKFKGGNIFEDDINKVLESKPFKFVTKRSIENIDPCAHCSIRHFCGAPCPAEAYGLHGNIETRGAFCRFYEEQVRYAFCLIADGKENAYLWDNWDKGMKATLGITKF
ncbi:MAG: peptide-modifying radical SAM enzyme CbpB [Elusimicrobia bacterium]|nr:peptide-modifying radical SAM enzyme CbpB [Elusimicrobiota bacterium]MBU2614963.1 peptide-modifying radical SAM enzyme CbpB [Elusimicrobiota bacterium]